MFTWLLLVPIIKQDLDLNLVVASPTPTATPMIKLVKPNLIKKFDLIELKNINKRGELKNVRVTMIDAKGIIVDSEGVSIKVNLLTNTHFRRKFWGKSSVAEISVGDSINVVGKWANEGKTEINATLVRDLSIQKRFGVFFGTINKITDSGFVMTTIQIGEETVILDTTSKIINRQGGTQSVADIQVGHRIRVRGLWNSTTFTITEVTEVKDFSLP